MNKHIENIVESTEELRQTILNHPVYAAIQDIEDLQIFMQYHIYAVWDFMSLLKALQNNLTCTSIPWFPVGDGETRHLINEIVVGEESDVDLQGIRKSHFELYVDAMNQCGASTDEIHTFLKKLQESGDLGTAFTAQTHLQLHKTLLISRLTRSIVTKVTCKQRFLHLGGKI